MANEHYEVINGQRVKVTVLPAAEAKTRKPGRKYVTQKERAAKAQAQWVKLAFMYDAYELATQFGVEQKTITESEFLHEHSRAPKRNTKPRLNDYEL